MTADFVRIFDTTLRDGEQAPGCSMSLPEKMQVAEQLARLNVDIIEAGFPASSPDEGAAVMAIAERVGIAGGPVICGLARATLPDIDVCAQAVAPAARRRIHTFMATSDIHLRHKLRLSRNEVLARVAESVAYARSLCDDVEYSAEDASRSDHGFVCDVFAAAMEAGATTLNAPDTVGYATPAEYASLIARVVALAATGDGVVVSTHCHNDLGLAVANTLAGISAGARQVECTINALGERAGNASLEEVVMALATRRSIYHVRTNITTREIAETSRIVCKSTGVAMPPNKAIVGANAFAHEAGIHQDGMLKDSRTYEIMTPESVGVDRSTLVLGRHSGRGALRDRLTALGYDVNEDAPMSLLFEEFKCIAGRKKRMDDCDLRALMEGNGDIAGHPHALVETKGAQNGASAPRTLFEKIWDAHVVRAETRETPAIIGVDLHLVHEVTSPQAFAELRSRGLLVSRPERTIATMDHSSSTRPLPNRGIRGLPVIDSPAQRQLDELARNCEDFGVPLLPLGDKRQGIVHVIGPELGLTQPGMTIVCGDSHTSTHGAFGALGFGIGTSQVAHVLATQCVMQKKPRTLEVRIDGRLPFGVTAKDVILAIIAQIGVGGATGSVIEYRGSTIESLSMEERMTICNMSIEAGARAGLIAPDDTTFEYLAGRPFAPRGRDWDAAVERWRSLPSDADATFDSSISMDASTLAPMVTYGTNPGMGAQITALVPDPAALASESDPEQALAALRYMRLTPGQPLIGTPVDVVFIGSCTNSRISDLRAAAALMRGRSVAPGVRMLVVPGSQQVKRAAEAEGLDEIFKSAGAEWREAGCSMCIAMNDDRVAPGQLAVSTSNRNFEGRQGPGSRTLLASPLTAAATAVSGVLTDPRSLLDQLASTSISGIS
ncbi:MAG: 3-isopropylmalate dehydratase large subunit [Gemmatimonadaceae bacterium]|nr:3-isopropylmalate dehydratase large subunit [Gemmatimonadaceae bacterium]